MTPTDVALFDEARWLVDPEMRTFGHVVIDEAQNLTPMELRMVVRRARRQSLTILGDIAQRTTEAGLSTWEHVLGEAGVERFEARELELSYRVPDDFLRLAAGVADAGTRVPRGVRRAPQPPVVTRADGDDDLGVLVVELAERLRADVGGSVGIVCAHERLDALRGALSRVDYADAPRAAPRRRLRRRHARRARRGHQPPRPPRRQGPRVRRGRRRRAGRDPRRPPRRRPRRPLHRADPLDARARDRACRAAARRAAARRPRPRGLTASIRRRARPRRPGGSPRAPRAHARRGAARGRGATPRRRRADRPRERRGPPEPRLVRRVRTLRDRRPARPPRPRGPDRAHARGRARRRDGTRRRRPVRRARL